MTYSSIDTIEFKRALLDIQSLIRTQLWNNSLPSLIEASILQNYIDAIMSLPMPEKAQL